MIFLMKKWKDICKKEDVPEELVLWGRHFKEEGGYCMSSGHPLARNGVERRPRKNV